MTIGAWVTGALTSAANAELGVDVSADPTEQPRDDDASLSDQLADYERRNQLKLDELVLAVAALSEQIDKAAGPSARLVGIDHLARVIRPLEQVLKRADKARDNDTGAGRISSLPGARGG